MTVGTGHFDVLERSFVRVSDDRRIQAIVIAFCFGSLLEALAGQGTPVAITSVMLLAVGFRPVLAASTALVANTVPAAFGPLGLPITTAALVSVGGVTLLVRRRPGALRRRPWSAGPVLSAARRSAMKEAARGTALRRSTR